MKSYSLSIVLIFCTSYLYGQTFKHYTISGYVREAVTGESLIGVNIYTRDHKTGTVTNTYGFYSLTLPASDTIEIVYTYVGFKADTVRVPFYKDTDINISLQRGPQLDEVTITAERQEKQSESVKMSTIKLPVAQIKNVPSLLGEKDVLKVLQLMPGVQKGSEGSSGLYVRGGGPDQNLIILDDAIVYNASHLFGFFSLFNGDALKSVELIKGGFPARYGGRLSSVLDMNMKEGNKEEWHGEGGIGLISTHFTIEGPLKKDRSSIILSGRRTFADLLMYPFLRNQKTGYYFYDFNAKVNYDFGRNNKLYLSGYFGQDKYSIKDNSGNYNETAGFDWGNATATLRWNHLFSNKLFSNASVIFSTYKFRINDKIIDRRDSSNYFATFNSGIRDISVKYDVDYIPDPKHWIKAGVIAIYHRFNPNAFVLNDEENRSYVNDATNLKGIESGIYVEDTWHPVKPLRINGGLRFSQFNAKRNTYSSLEPRISTSLSLKNDFAVKASYATMNQYIHLLSNTGISLPTDLWVPVTDKVKPQRSQQVALGLVKDVSAPNLTFSFEGYYKTMSNVLGYKEGSTFIIVDDPTTAYKRDWQENVTAGRSWSYGMEFIIKKNTGRFTGWVGYTLSWTLMQFDSLNFGKKFYSRYDRRHDISVVGIYKITDHITASGTWVYGTGNAVTLPTSTYQIGANMPDLGPEQGIFSFNNRGNGYLGFDYGRKNNFRMSPYHRLDLGIQFHKTKKWGERTLDISVYNVYNRMNPFFYYVGTKYTDGKPYGVLKQVSLFPVIPSVSYSIKF